MTNPATIAALRDVRAKVTDGLWRNYNVSPFDDEGEYIEEADRGGCLIQLCCRVPYGYEAQEALARTLAARHPEVGAVWAQIVPFNDDEDRSADDILALIDETLTRESGI